MRKALIKSTALLVLSGFTLAVFAFAFHERDSSFLLRSRAISQIRAGIAGTVNKNPVDSALASVGAPLGLTALSPAWTPLFHDHSDIVIPSRAGYICPNKAPPARS
jgi:hypothetical protein